MTEPVLLVDKSDGIATLTLNRPGQLNALSLELRQALEREISALRDDPDIGVVILTGAGRAFCAGLDLKEIGAGVRPTRDETDPPTLLRSLPQPVICAINGLAVTGGLEIMLSCDILIATPEARIADTHSQVGFVAGWGLSQRLSRVIGVYRAKELSLTGNFLTAERAYEWGLLNRVVPGDELLPTCRALARDILSCVPESVRDYKRQIDGGFDVTLAEGMMLEQDVARTHKLPSASEVAARRADIQARGRAQAK